MREFYTNLSAVSNFDPDMIIREKEVQFGAEQINDMYELSDADIKP